MSTNHPPILFPHRDVLTLGRWLLGVILREHGASYIVGSLRRCELCARGACDRTTKDLDLMIPGPAGGTDEGYTKLQRCVDLAEDAQPLLPGMAPVARGSFIVAKKGFAPGFKAMEGYIDLIKAERHTSFPRDQMSGRWWQEAGHGLLPVQIWRYVPGAEGNMGWSLLIRTGPNTEADPFGQACLARWKALTGGKSDGGFPRDGAGRKYPVPTEAAAFDLLQMRYLEPHMRTATRVPRD